jgi:hypothetical protein
VLLDLLAALDFRQVHGGGLVAVITLHRDRPRERLINRISVDKQRQFTVLRFIQEETRLSTKGHEGTRRKKTHKQGGGWQQSVVAPRPL